MKKFCGFLVVLALLASVSIANAETVNEKELKPLILRVGLDGKVEKARSYIPQYGEREAKISNVSKETNEEVKTPAGQGTDKSKEAAQKELTYNDLDAQKIADEVKGEMEDEREQTLVDLRILWQAAVERSETIRFAIFKLSNPEGDQEKKSVVKKILTPLTSVAPLVGMGMANPVTGGSTLIGGGLLSSLLSDDSLMNQHLSRVTDTELVLLAQEIDDLQRQLVELYQNYSSALERLHHVDKIVQNRYKYYTSAQNSSPEVLSVADVFYREALDMQYKARQDVLNSRAALEQFVGNDAIVQVDKNIKDRLASQ